MKKIVFLTGTRADYGKLKSLMKSVKDSGDFELHIFVTGMHMIQKYGSTYKEIEKDGFENIYKYINQKMDVYQSMDVILSNTLIGFSNYITELSPELIVVHGDRVEALAAAIVGAFNNIKVMHIEGGEVSGTIDESIRHSITKLSHIHLVANEEAKKRILQLGEKEESIFIFGSPDIDIMYSKSLPSINDVKERYSIKFKEYSILMYHPVTTDMKKLQNNVKELIDCILDDDNNYIVVYPNNDWGSNLILNEYKRLKNKKNILIYPSIRFEYFLTLLNNCNFIIGNSSAGIREACVYGKPSIDIGSRQNGRYKLEKLKNIIHVNENKNEIKKALKVVNKYSIKPKSHFGSGKSSQKFMEILYDDLVWDENIQKTFNDIDF